MNVNTCHVGDCRDLLPKMAAAGVCAQTCITSPPYWALRDYGVAGQLGLEATLEEWVAAMVGVFRLVRDVLADDGTLWLNVGDSYNAGTNVPGNPSRSGANHGGWAKSHTQIRANVIGLKPKDLMAQPWRLALALQADGWYLRQDIIWHKPNPMPETLTDRCTKAHEYLFLLSRSSRYFYDFEAMQEPASTGEMRNRRSVWTIGVESFEGAHFATFPRALVAPCIIAGSRKGDVVLDPFMGSGTTAEAAEHLDRQWIGCELQPDYLPLQAKRLSQRAMTF